MPTLLFRSPSDPAVAWTDALHLHDPGLEVRVWPDTGAVEDIEYALVWASPDGFLHDLPNLRVVFSLGAGVDHLMGAQVPEGVDLVRMVDPALTEGMIEYVTYQVLRHHRHMAAYERQQTTAEWRIHPQIRPGERRIGLLGLGELGGACARTLGGLGFDVAGWARSSREIPGVTAVTGEDGLDWLLGRSDIVICLLPLTDATRGILDESLFRRMQPGSTLINAARGQHLVEDDLLIALGEGHLGHAVLDAFRDEPLPPGHAFWRHPHVTVTPHIASLTNPETGAAAVVHGIHADQAGEPIPHRVDRGRGY
ncbi:MAG: 2-hydroxyacid dehydrogenase [Halofilum sp. (in: g-proteobacteria)]